MGSRGVVGTIFNILAIDMPYYKQVFSGSKIGGLIGLRTELGSPPMLYYN